jgi:GNAT superfamily N-acetyltransferase
MSRWEVEHEAATAFLRRDAHANRELLLALRYEPMIHLQLAAHNGAITGVLVRGAGPFTPVANWIRLEAIDPAAVQALWTAIREPGQCTFSVHRAWIADLLIRESSLQPTGDGVLGYIVDRARLMMYDAHDPRLLTLADESLVERSRCGWSRSYFRQLISDGRRPWAIVRDGAIVCRASSGYLLDDAEEVVGVWTHPQWRGRGYARSIVSAVAADILDRHGYAAYTTTYANRASQNVARAVGFWSSFDAPSLRVAGA